MWCYVIFYQAEDGIRGLGRSRGVGDGDKIIAIGEVEKPGGRMVFTVGKVYVEKDGIRTQIASARAVMAVIDNSDS